jgi:hypothetical protein
LVNPPLNGQITTSKQSTLKGYPLETILQFVCLPGFELIPTLTNQNDNSIIKCQNLNGIGSWTDHTKPECFKIRTTKVLTTTTTTTTSMTTTSENKAVDNTNCILNTKDDQKVFFLNPKMKTFINDKETISYRCMNDPTGNYYESKCSNGLLVFDQICNSIDTNRNCDQPEQIQNGYNKYSSISHGSKVFYQCFNGYRLSESYSYLSCNNGKWIGTVPTCSKSNF